ncbi:MAG: sigma-E processing peptidase SpoIIGA [Lachnospiraceae bacterium]
MDVFFVINFSMDLLALQTVNQILYRNARSWRLCAASAFGTVFTIVVRVLFTSGAGWRYFVHLIGNPLMLFLAYGKTTARQFVKQWIWVYVWELLQGGLVYGCLQNTVFGDHIVIIWLCLAVAAILLPYVFRSYHAKEAQVVSVQLRQKTTCLTMQAFYDTGNHLQDPFFGMPVQVVDQSVLHFFLSKESIPVRKIPFSAVGTENGLLEAVTLEKMTIQQNGQTKQISPVILAAAQQELFRGKSYQMLLNVDTLRI